METGKDSKKKDNALFVVYLVCIFFNQLELAGLMTGLSSHRDTQHPK